MRNRLISVGILTFALLLLCGCGLQNQTDPDGVSRATEDRYRENEVREYRGARLDPAVGPRDNSIKGVQHVDIAVARP